jgi:regulator of PEP synthase PpsR (kinase-PPPase family)
MLLVFEPPIIAPLSKVEEESLVSSNQTSSTNSTSESVQEISTNIIAETSSTGSGF